MQWIGDFNPKMINVAESFGDTYRSRTLATYRYLFDRTWSSNGTRWYKNKFDFKT